MGALVGVDIGGTGVRAAAVDADGRVGPVRRHALSDRAPDRVIDTVVAAVRGCGAIDRVGVAVPGFVHRGTVLASPNFPAWSEVPLQDRLVDALGLPVVVENDANCATLGAWRLRGGHDDLVLLTLGTGVGGGVISAGRLLRGSRGTGAELGHVYAGGGAPCGCGGIGCLETWCGTWGLLRLVRERGREFDDGEALAAAADEGDPDALAAFEAAGRALGRGLTTLVNVFNPDVVVLAGGLTAARRWLGPPARDWLARYGIAPSVDAATLHWEGSAEGFAIAGAAEAAGRPRVSGPGGTT